MKIYTEIIGNLQDPEWVKKAREAEIEYIDLDQWTAQKSRFVVKGDRENEYAVALKRHSQMLDGATSIGPQWSRGQRSTFR